MDMNLLTRKVSLLACVSVGLLVSGCATTGIEDRPRIGTLPLAADHSDFVFSLTTPTRLDSGCAKAVSCRDDEHPAAKFTRQVARVDAALQIGVQNLYPDLAQKFPNLIGQKLDVYVVEGDSLESSSSANGRIALSAELGKWQPYDEWTAFVIAREMGHVIARHHQENSSSGLVTSIILNILLPGSGLLKKVISVGAQSLASGSKEDVQTLEADAIAHDILKASGYGAEILALSLMVAPVTGNNNRWSSNFRKSSDNFLRAAPVAELVTSLDSE